MISKHVIFAILKLIHTFPSDSYKFISEEINNRPSILTRQIKSISKLKFGFYINPESSVELEGTIKARVEILVLHRLCKFRRTLEGSMKNIKIVKAVLYYLNIINGRLLPFSPY